MKTTTRPPLSALLQWAIALLLAMAAWAPLAGRAAPAPLSGQARPVVERFLREQTAALPGQVQISIDTPASGALPPCEALQAFLPGGARLWGRVSVGVRCTAALPWTRYVQAYIGVTGAYRVATRQIEPGQALGPGDTALREADLTTLPASVLTDALAPEGWVALNRINPGAPLRREQLRAAAVVQQGQSIKVHARGAGFVVSTEGKAMAEAPAGALLQVRMPGGQLVSGTVQADGSVERVQ